MKPLFFLLLFLFLIGCTPEPEPLECPFIFFTYETENETNDWNSVTLNYEDIKFRFYLREDYISIAYYDFRDLNVTVEARLHLSRNTTEFTLGNMNCLNKHWDEDTNMLQDNITCHADVGGNITYIREW